MNEMSQVLFQNFWPFHHHFRISLAQVKQNAVKMKNTNKSDAENISKRSLIALFTEDIARAEPKC